MSACCTFPLIFVNKSMLTATAKSMLTCVRRRSLAELLGHLPILQRKYEYFTTFRKKYTYLYFVTSKGTSKNVLRYSRKVNFST